MTLTDKLVDDLRAWLGDEGLKFFGEMRAERGGLLPAHFNSGQQVRNWMRGHEDTKDGSAHDYDELWQEAVYRALDGSTGAWKRVLEPDV